MPFNILEKIKDPKFLPLAIAAAGFGLFAFMTKKTDNVVTDDNVIESMPESSQYYDIMAFGQDLVSELSLAVDNSIENMTNTVSEDLTESLSDLTAPIGDLTDTVKNLETAVSNIKPPTIINPPAESSKSTPSPQTKTPSSSKRYFTIEKYTGKNPYEGTLGGIAKKFGTDIKTLMKLNPWIKNPNIIPAGKKLRVA